MGAADEMDKFVTRTKRTDIRTDLPKELPSLGKSTARPWKGIMSPKTPAKRKEPEGPAMYVTAPKAYINEYKEEYKKKHPEKESKDILKELKAQYDALSDDAKKPYEEAAAKDKQRYIEEMKAVRGAARTLPCRAPRPPWPGDTACVRAGGP